MKRNVFCIAHHDVDDLIGISFRLQYKQMLLCALPVPAQYHTFTDRFKLWRSATTKRNRKNEIKWNKQKKRWENVFCFVRSEASRGGRCDESSFFNFIM